MDTKNRELYQRIADFNIDDPDVKLPFTARLARENDWDLKYARRVVEEYGKFMFLAVAAGHPVTPSEQIDQAWHLHLVYTRSYWGDFCGKILGQPVHHGPTKGGRDEQAKYHQWYKRTKASYRQSFGHEPPVDIWPGAKKRFGEDLQYLRVNTCQNWIIPKRTLKWLALSIAMLLAALLTITGCVAQGGRDSLIASPPIAAARAANLLDLHGSQFLGFFVAAFAVAVCIAAAIRWYIRRSSDELSFKPVHVDPYEVAYLAGGEDTAINAALASLVSRGALKVQGEERRLVRNHGEIPGSLHPLEAAIFHAVDPALGASIAELHRDWPPLVEIAERLTSLGLIVSDERDWLGRVLPVLVVLAVPLIGAIKVLVGLSRDKPVGFLVISCIIAAVVAFVAFARRLLRTWEGDRVLDRMKAENAAAGADMDCSQGELVGPDLAMALGLFGIGVLEAGPLAELHAALKPRSESGGWGGCGGDGGGDGGGCGGGCGGCGG